MKNELIQLTAIEAVSRLNSGDISPLEMISAAEARIMEVEPLINALPTLCFERARERASLLMAGKNRNNSNKPGWLAGLPVAIKDLTDV
ncbi:MAG: amidase family protein, partial [Alphaproteobacteria bacterium]|nr:amidase family protein [Alphaproteobacteria bacterium]